LVGKAGRFREPIADGAGKDDLLDTAQVDQVTDTVGCNGRFGIARRCRRSGARRRGGQVYAVRLLASNTRERLRPDILDEQ
jgi:hypothetical protein